MSVVRDVTGHGGAVVCLIRSRLVPLPVDIDDWVTSPAYE